MTRLALFSPLPPVRTGVAAVAADLLPALAGRGYLVDVFVDPGAGALPAGASSAHDFVWRHQRQPYDLVVYQLGNSSHHDYAWAYALRYPGLVVLHDTRLHHARAAHLLRERRAPDYRTELAWNEPSAPDGIAELGIAGFDNALYYDWPMVRTLVETSRLVAVHGEGARLELIETLAAADPSADRARLGDRIVSVRLGHGEPASGQRAADARRRVRQRYNFTETDVVFGVFGGLTREKRIPQILDAFAAIAPFASASRLLLAGARSPVYDVAADIAGHGLQDRVTVAGYLDRDEELTDLVLACDVTLHLRWPTARETSGPWLRALAAGRATIITDLVHLGDAPSLDPRTWTLNQLPIPNAQHPGSELLPPTSYLLSPVCVAVDILDEDHSLRIAMRRLASDADLRRDLGRAAEAWWRAEHSIERMTDDYDRVLHLAATQPDNGPARALPGYMRDTGGQRLDVLLEPYGLGRNPLE